MKKRTEVVALDSKKNSVINCSAAQSKRILLSQPVTTTQLWPMRTGECFPFQYQLFSMFTAHRRSRSRPKSYHCLNVRLIYSFTIRFNCFRQEKIRENKANIKFGANERPIQLGFGFYGPTTTTAAQVNVLQ